MIILGPSPATTKTVYPAIAQLKRSWSDEWVTAPELKVPRVRRVAGGGEVAQADVMRSYGQVKLPWESAPGYKSPWTGGSGWWLRILIAGPQGYRTQFVGRIEGEIRDPHGVSSHGAAGVQQWRAYGPRRILEKLGVSKSWQNSAIASSETPTPIEVDWVPDVNRDGVGNRSTLPDADGVYCYDVTIGKTWTAKEIVEYWLHHYADDSANGGPAWSLTGDVDTLERLTETIEMGTTQTVAQLLDAAIPRRCGLDWQVVPTDDGFAVQVFALSAVSYSFGGQTIPKNEAEVRLSVGTAKDVLSARIVQSDEQGYKKIRLLGNRVVICASLMGTEVDDADRAGTLWGSWTDEEEEAYKVDVTAAEVWPDIAERLHTTDSDVYRQLVLSYDARGRLDELHLTPTVDGDGELTESTTFAPWTPKTLDWTPLEPGIDYSADADPALADQDTDDTADRLPPMAFLRRYEAGEEIAGGFVDSPDYDVYIGAAEAGFHVEAVSGSLGLRLTGSHNWELAANHFEDGPTDVVPLYDHEATVATLAWETDQRFGLEWAASDATLSDGVLEVEVPDANLWVLGRKTVVGVSPEGELLESAETETVLRQDTDRLLFVLAGLLSRYYGARHRAEITQRGLWPYAGLLGQILRSVETGGELHEMAAPITAIEWTIDAGGNSTTTISAGFA